jgi:hypothetical protein
MKIAGRYEPTGATAGGGGMGEIVECVDSHLQRRVIIKRLQVGVEERRLIDEHKALAKVRSKHVVQLYDVIELTDRKKKAIVMEFIEGENLHVGSFKAGRKYLNVLWQIASGLRDIHEVGVIHRDIKPGMRHARMGERRNQTRCRANSDGSPTPPHRTPTHQAGSVVGRSHSDPSATYSVPEVRLQNNRSPFHFKGRTRFLAP